MGLVQSYSGIMEVGYITVIIDPLAGSISVKGDRVSARWFFFAKAL